MSSPPDDGDSGAPGAGRRPVNGWLRESALVRFFGWRLLLRLAVLGLLVAVYYALDWVALRLGLRHAVVAALALLGHHSVPLEDASGLDIAVAGAGRFAVTANCTYADLVLITAPFCWRFRRSLATNLGRLAALTAAVLSLNVVRVVLALHFFHRGATWYLAHDVPDLAIHYTAMIVLVLLALRSDRIETSDTAAGSV